MIYSSKDKARKLMHLIHVPQNDLSPVGGPCGYLYNLKNGLDAIDCNEIDFLPALPFAKRAIRKASFLVHSHQSLEQKLEYRADELLTYLKRDNVLSTFMQLEIYMHTENLLSTTMALLFLPLIHHVSHLTKSMNRTKD
jgi:hypothetical protein